MFEEKLRKYIKEDEQTVLIVRKYLLAFAWPIFVSAVFIIAPFFFLYPLFHWGPWGVLVFFVLLLFGIFLALRTFIIYSFNVFILTNQRIIDIDQRGLFNRTISETTYGKIQDVSFAVKGIMQTIFHYGSIIIQTAGSQANIELSTVKDPEKVQRLITQIQQESPTAKSLSSEDLINMVKYFKEKSQNDPPDINSKI